LNCSIFLPVKPARKGGDWSQWQPHARDDAFVIDTAAGKWRYSSNEVATIRHNLRWTSLQSR
jgi:hypothetical protein